ncbi:MULTISPECIES: hypothetical protein [Mycobacterium]|uniref:Uncharacterized protein n=3 Tax=Mycobacterium TaxID=1763 RepID=A0A1X1Y1D3_9MYCO|nr:MULTISPECIES: hypothetical protein [Mycobacterium]ORW04905.1 hypothetical protein AWC14_02120 [Mycobacterium kyorinense]
MLNIHIPYAPADPGEGWDEEQQEQNLTVADATEFAWDGCHKIYLIRSAEERAQLVEMGYGEGGSEILPISELPEVWGYTCGLRFISSGDLTQHYVEQCLRDVEVTWLSDN